MPRASSAPDRWTSASSLALSLVGLAVSGYLTYEHFSGSTSLACPENARINCTKVTTSSYSVFLGVPVAVWGVVFFAVLVVLTSPAAWRSDRAEVRVARLVVVSIGVVSVLYLVWAELYEVGAICLWCTTVHALTLLVFATTIFGEALRE